MEPDDSLQRYQQRASIDADAIAAAAHVPIATYTELAPCYAHIADWAHRRAKHHDGLWTLGIQGVQGAGKSTLASCLAELLRREGGLRVATMSIDDLYFTRSQRRVLAREVHPLLQTRGVPGTHDVLLGRDTIAALREGKPIKLPRFDKAADDRVPEADWLTAEPPVDVLLFDGWFLGAGAPPVAQLGEPINALERDEDPDGRWRNHVCTQLRERYPPLWRELDALCMLQAPDAECGFTWRWHAEQRTRSALEARGADTSQLMDEQQVRRFVDLDMRIARFALATLPANADAIVRLNAARRVTNLRFNAVSTIGSD